MATSASKSVAKRASSGGDCSTGRRSRSVGRFSRPMAAETETDYNRSVPRGKFVNTTRGSGTPFPEISLDDLALELFSSSSNNGNESDGVTERKERPGRSVSRLGEVGRWASDTASSRRRARSVSKSRGGGVASTGSTSGGKNAVSKEAGCRRRRSLSAARYQISDSESEVDNSRNSGKCAAVRGPANLNGQNSLGLKTTASNNQRLGRSRSHKNLSLLDDGYSNRSSALTHGDSKDSHFGKNGFEKIIRAVYAEKKLDYPTADVANSGLYEAMRKEIRYAVEEIRTEMNQTMGRNQTAVTIHDHLQSDNSETLQDSSGIKENYGLKLEQLEKRKKDLCTELFLEEQGQQVLKVLEECPSSRTSAVADKPSRARKVLIKRNSNRIRISENLIEEAEQIFEDFICNVEDADISSFDGERSDGGSTLEGTSKARDSTSIETEIYRSPVEMDGVILPWLQWETSHDGFLSGKSKARTPVTPKTLNWDSERDMIWCNDQSRYSNSSHGSWSPGIFENPETVVKQDTSKTREGIKDSSLSYFDMAEYKRLQNSEDLLYEMYRQQNRINSGSLLLCTDVFY